MPLAFPSRVLHGVVYRPMMLLDDDLRGRCTIFFFFFFDFILASRGAGDLSIRASPSILYSISRPLLPSLMHLYGFRDIARSVLAVACTFQVLSRG
jgi:hypothetical protein